MTNENGLFPDDVQFIDDIRSMTNLRRDSYKCAIVTSVYSKRDEIWKNVFTKITLSNEADFISTKLDYSNCILNKICIPVDDFLDILSNLATNKSLKIKNLPEVKADGKFNRHLYMPYLPSNADWLKTEWPSNFYGFEIENNSRGFFESGPLVSPQHPHFPHGDGAFKFFTGIDNINHLNGYILIFLPNYQIKINKLTISSGFIDLDIINNSMPQEELIGKLYYQKESHIEVTDFSIDGDFKKISIDFVPEFLSLYILKKSGEILDFRELHLKYPGKHSEDVIIKIKEDDIQEIIRQGENQSVEFKRQLNSDKKEFIESVVAFANTNGGIILLGVDDRANITGFDEDKIEETIVNSIRSRCDPFIEPKIEKMKIDEKPIIIVRIDEGNNKPYVLREKGVFVRNGSTDRIANRIELDEFYDERMKKTNRNTNRKLFGI